ncbi:MAG: type VI secretion system baseplate subunit TssE [Sedimentisphaerales bacterium]|nr:type VI secretion system baseplate subunit TssE [Sedimentisphaerales bacterium]
MAKLRRIDSVLPCLLNRLTDDRPDVTKETTAERITSMQKYRASVLRDLVNLLNSKAPPADDDIYDFAEAEQSVLSYGVPDFCGMTISDIGVREFESKFERAIRLFEPRIESNTLSVRAVFASEVNPNRTLALEIEGQLWALPAPDHLFVRTDLDMETGHCELGDSPNG